MSTERSRAVSRRRTRFILLLVVAVGLPGLLVVGWQIAGRAAADDCPPAVALKCLQDLSPSSMTLELGGSAERLACQMRSDGGGLAAPAPTAAQRVCLEARGQTRWDELTRLDARVFMPLYGTFSLLVAAWVGLQESPGPPQGRVPKGAARRRVNEPTGRRGLWVAAPIVVATLALLALDGRENAATQALLIAAESTGAFEPARHAALDAAASFVRQASLHKWAAAALWAASLGWGAWCWRAGALRLQRWPRRVAIATAALGGALFAAAVGVGFSDTGSLALPVHLLKAGFILVFLAMLAITVGVWAARPSLFLNLSALQALDILLSTERGAISKLIRIAQAWRGGRAAPYSHAALVLSPSVIVEAIGPRGTALCDLVWETPWVEQRAAGDGSAPAELHCRMIEGRLAVFVELPVKTAVAVYRHTAAGPQRSRECRRAALVALADVYLAGYSELYRLAAPIVDLSPGMQDFLQRLAEQRSGHRLESGPFCSELVSALLGEAFEDDAAARLRAHAHAKKAPMDFAWEPHKYRLVDDAVFVGSAAELPGQVAPEPLREKIARLVNCDAVLESQGLKAKLLQIVALVSGIVATEAGTPDQRRQHYEERSTVLRKAWIDAIELALALGPDPVWAWVRDSNACHAVCPGGGPALQRLREQAMAHVLTFNGFKAVRGRWAGGRCEGIEQCIAHKAGLDDIERLQKEHIDRAIKKRYPVDVPPTGSQPPQQ